MLVTVKRTKQIAQFEPLTIEQSLEIDPEVYTPSETMRAMLEVIDGELEQYIHSHSEDAGIGLRKLADMCVGLVIGRSLTTIEDFENLSAKESVFLNEVKKSYYRTDEYKNKVSNSSVENESNRKG